MMKIQEVIINLVRLFQDGANKSRKTYSLTGRDK